MRDTEVIPPFSDALPAGASSYRRKPSCPSYQYAHCIEPLAPTHQISILLGMRDTEVIPPSVAAMFAGANSKRRHVGPSKRSSQPICPRLHWQSSNTLPSIKQATCVPGHLTQLLLGTPR